VPCEASREQVSEHQQPAEETKQDPESPPSSPQVPCWPVGALVERLLDDISDIWVGAEVLRCNDDGLYDVTYSDNGSVERKVDGSEIRARKARLDLPPEVWTGIGQCFFQKRDLATFETITRSTRAVSLGEKQRWWCRAYHERFGRCGPRCSFERVKGPEGSAAASRAMLLCLAVGTTGRTQVDKKLWKTRYMDQERLIDPVQLLETPGASAAPGDAAYGVSGRRARHANLDGRLRYGHNAHVGMYFDPRLGHMVRDV